MYEVEASERLLEPEEHAVEAGRLANPALDVTNQSAGQTVVEVFERGKALHLDRRVLEIETAMSTGKNVQIEFGADMNHVIRFRSRQKIATEKGNLRFALHCMAC